MIKYYPYDVIAPELKSDLERYVDEEFGNVSFVKERVWAQPDWAFIKYEGDAIATFYHVLLREVVLDGSVHLIAGINNVITPKPFRGRGYSSQTLRETESIIFEELQCEYGLLLCADNLIPFYSRLNWYKVESELYYDQPVGKQQYDSNVMLFTPEDKERIYPQKIDINGLPW